MILYVWWIDDVNERNEISKNGKIEVYDLAAIPEVFALNGTTAVQIPVETALAMDNANVQSSTAQTADAQPVADAQATQAAAR